MNAPPAARNYGRQITAGTQAAIYASDPFGWHVFPCVWAGPKRKTPLVKRGFHAATRDALTIHEWWVRWPAALIGVACGASGLGILDVDVKDPANFGPGSLRRLGPIPRTWIAHTPSNGWHYWFNADGLDIPSTSNKIGPGLDVRARGGYAVAPSAGSGYRWHEYYNPETIPLAPAPAWLIPTPPKPKVIFSAKPVKPVIGLSPYADAAIARACDNIRDAANGQQRVVLVKESFSIGTLAGVGAIPQTFARLALIDAGCGMPSFDPHHPWTPAEVQRVVTGCFAAGMARPRTRQLRPWGPLP